MLMIILCVVNVVLSASSSEWGELMAWSACLLQALRIYYELEKE
jgi:hypothetical protein